MPFILRVAVMAALAVATPAALAEPLTLEAAISRTLGIAPEAAASTARLDALRAARSQAGVRPNPSVEVLAENFAGTGPYQFVDSPEVTGTYAQTVERGGKREARVALAEGDVGVAEAEAIVERLDIAARAQRAYVDAAAAQAEIDIAGERLRLAEALAREVDRRVAAARDPVFAGTRAATRVAEARVDAELAERARAAAMLRLAALWGGAAEEFNIPAADFFRLNRPLVRGADSARADLAVIEARVKRADAAIALERARRVQDPTFRAGLRYLRPADDVAAVAGFSIPLARFDTNRANVDRALAERRRADADLEVFRQARRRDLQLVETRVAQAWEEADAIRKRVVPGAERTLAQVREGYARGGFSYLDVTEAQTTLAMARARLIAATRAYHTAGVEHDRLTGRFIELVIQEEGR